MTTIAASFGMILTEEHSTERPLTLGEARVRTRFNPDNNEDVGEYNRLLAVAQTAAEEVANAFTKSQTIYNALLENY